MSKFWGWGSTKALATITGAARRTTRCIGLTFMLESRVFFNKAKPLSVMQLMQKNTKIQAKARLLNEHSDRSQIIFIIKWLGCRKVHYNKVENSLAT